MNFFVNELSFEAQAADKYSAEILMNDLLDLLKAVQPFVKGGKLLSHSTLSSRNIVRHYTVSQWIYDNFDRDRDRVKLFLLLTKQGPFADNLLRIECNDHICNFNTVDVSFSSLAGAAYYSGITISVKRYFTFNKDELVVQFAASRAGACTTEVKIQNYHNIRQVDNLKRTYAPSPKHALGGWGSLMDLDDVTAQNVLDNGTICGKQIYGKHNGKYYEFQPDNVGGFHGYVIDKKNVPPAAIRKLD